MLALWFSALALWLGCRGSLAWSALAWLLAAACLGFLGVMLRRTDRPGDAWRPALGWLAVFAAGLVPVIPVASAWSSYYFTYPLIGFSGALAAATVRIPRIEQVGLLGVLFATSQLQHLAEMDRFGPRNPAGSHVTLADLRRAQQAEAEFNSALQAALPAIPDSSLLIFNGLPARSGLISGDGPAIRLLYQSPSLSACYEGQIDSTTVFARNLILMHWNPETSRFTALTIDSTELEVSPLGLELGLHPAGAAASMTYLVTRRGPTSERLWRMGYFLRELGDTARARETWMRAARLAGASARVGGAEADFKDMQLASARSYRSLREELFAAPENPLLLWAAARAAMREGQGTQSCVLYFRAIEAAPRERELLREAGEVFTRLRMGPRWDG